MTIMTMTVQYKLLGDTSSFENGLGAAATMIAATPGLLWKVWGIDVISGVGTSTYLFKDREYAEAFEAGPVLDAVRAHPLVTKSLSALPRSTQAFLT